MVIVAGLFFVGFNSLQSKVNDWNSKDQVKQKAEEIGNDAQSIAKDIVAASSSGDASQVLSDCQKLGSDVKAAQALPAAPVASLNDKFQASLTDFSQASSQCVKGINDGDSNLVNDAARSLKSGLEKMTEFAKQLAVYVH